MYQKYKGPFRCLGQVVWRLIALFFIGVTALARRLLPAGFIRSTKGLVLGAEAPALDTGHVCENIEAKTSPITTPPLSR